MNGLLAWPGNEQPLAEQGRLPQSLRLACRRLDIPLTQAILVAQVRPQRVEWFERASSPWFRPGEAVRWVGGRGTGANEFETVPPWNQPYRLQKRFRASTSRFGTGQQAGSNRTPLGLHRIAEKVGRGHVVGTVFESRQAVGLTWQGRPEAAIAHRILWLEGLDPGWNQGGNVDTRARYIYIHGLAQEPSLGRPASRGCIHLAGSDLMPLFDRLAAGTLVWIAE